MYTSSKHTLMLPGLLVVLSMALTVATPSALHAQVDVSGAWTLSVTTDNGITSPSLTLEQDGTELTGHYSSAALGETGVRGRVDGSQVTIRFSAELQGNSIGVMYRGTVAEDGTMSGTIDIADGMLTGTFTATRSLP